MLLLVGMLTERDYARKVALMARGSRDTPLRIIMTRPVMYVQPRSTSQEYMALMTENRPRHLPVMDGGKLIGLISRVRHQPPDFGDFGASISIKSTTCRCSYESCVVAGTSS